MKNIFLFLSLSFVNLGFSQSYYLSYDDDSQKYGFRGKTTDSLNGKGFIYNKVNIFNDNFYSCCLADTIFKGNCTLLDSSLNTLIPFGQFSEIILSEDGNYATVATEEYELGLRQYPSDTVTVIIKNKDWGVYDIKNHKWALFPKYSYLSKVYKDGTIVFNEGGRGFMNDQFGQGGLFGITNLREELVCKPKYTYIGPFNNKDLAVAVVGGDNMDGINYGDYISINKKGENTRPSFCLERYPSVKKISVPNDSNFYTSKELEEFMNYKSSDDSLTRKLLFNLKYEFESFGDDQVTIDEYGNEIYSFTTSYQIYEKESRVDIWKPLPSNLKYYYEPKWSSINNWGNYKSFKTNKIPEYEVFNDKEQLQIATFYQIDSIYASDYDSLEIDYMYPGIYNQNKKTLDKRFFNDVMRRKEKGEMIYESGLVFKESYMDTIRYRNRLTCDSVDINLTICKYCYNDEARFATKHYYKKKMGLLINEEVVVPPVYNYIVMTEKDNYLLLDTLNLLWSYNSKTKTIERSTLRFEKILNRVVNSEESNAWRPFLFIVKNEQHKIIGYDIDYMKMAFIGDSISGTAQSSGFTEEEGEFVYNVYMNLGPVFDRYENLAVFRNDTIYEYRPKEHDLLFRQTKTSEFAFRKTLQVSNTPITFNKIRYNKSYYQKGFYLLEQPDKKYIFSNTGFFTANSIAVDSIVQIRPYIVYYAHDKMYLADFTGKEVKVKNKKDYKYFISILDSAKSIEVILDYDGADYHYGNYQPTSHDLYKADGIYKSISTGKAIQFIPGNYNNCTKEEISLFIDDIEKGLVRSNKFYLLSCNSKKYLCSRKEAFLEKDSLYNAVAVRFTEEQYEVLDSAQNFIFPKHKEIHNSYYDLKGFYKADGELKSSNTFKKLPIQNCDSLILIHCDEGVIETFAFCSKGKWKVLCINTLSENEYVVFEQFIYKSYHELRKVLYPYQTSSVECNVKTEQNFFRQQLMELAIKARDKKPWK